MIGKSAWQQRILAVSDPLPGSIPYDNRRPLRVQARYAGLSVLEFLCNKLAHRGRSFWQQALADGRIRYRDAIASGQETTAEGAELIHTERQLVEPAVDPRMGLVFEDAALLVLDKSAPLPVHPCGRFNKNTVLGILTLAFPELAVRPVHRIDANTTGLLVLAKTREAARSVAEQLCAQELDKRYLAEVTGRVPAERFTVDLPIASERASRGSRVLSSTGNAATSEFRRLGRRGGRTLLEARPLTGRTNQIRLHLSGSGMPIVGDRVYGGEASGQGFTSAAPLRLHAWKATLRHPDDGRTLHLEAPPPPWAQYAVE